MPKLTRMTLKRLSPACADLRLSNPVLMPQQPWRDVPCSNTNSKRFWLPRQGQMRRRDFIALFGGAAATWPLAARAQAERVRRIGVLMGLDANDLVGQSEVRALKEGLQELGWIEGRNLQIEYGWAGGEPGRIQASAKELVGLKCEVIAARSTPAVAALLKETRAIPIVFTYVFDPIGSGFVRSFARPG